MSILSDKEIRATHPYWNDLSDNAVARVRVIATAQEAHTRKEIKEGIEKLLISTASMEAVTLPTPNFYIRETSLVAFWKSFEATPKELIE